MAIVFSNNFPGDVEVQVSQYLAKVASGKINNSIKSNITAGLHISEPLRIFDMTVDQMAAGTPLFNLESRFWRHLLLDDKQAVAQIDMTQVKHRTQRFIAKVTELHHGRRAEATRKAIEVAQKLVQVVADDYEIGLLQSHEMHFMALWLRCLTSKEDLFIPVEPDKTTLVKGRPHTLAQIGQVLQPMAISVQRDLMVNGGHVCAG